MKKIIFSLCLLPLAFTSCTDLDETIYDTIAAEKYEFTAEDAASMFSPVYSNLRNMYWGWNGLNDISEECSDLWCTPFRIGVGWGDLYITLHQHTYVNTLDHVWTEWYYGYNGITACNQLLDDEGVQSSPTAVAQLRGYRALYYYLLFDLFRNIPLDTTYDHPDGWQPSQAKPQETWDFIISELNDIKGKCGADNGMGQINDATVNMILAKMYLNHEAWFRDGDKSFYGKAIDVVNEIIDSKQYALSANYLDNFKEDISGSPEIIFGIPFEYLYASGNCYANKWMNEAGRATWGFNGWATGGSACLPQFLATYDKDDMRLNETWIWGQQYALNGDPIITDDGPLVYTTTLSSINGCYPMEGARLVKYEIIGSDWGTSYDDVPFFRYADALMIKAECLLRLGGYKGETEQDAANLVTQVRQRNFANPAKATRTVAQLKGGSCYKYGYQETDPNTGEKFETTEGGADIILGGLLDDLAWEFIGEHHRRQDLVRFTMTNGQNVYNGKSWFCKKALTDVNDHHLDIFPIGIDFLDGNPNLVQNPGY
ncbi:MAG: RagB/SusD family nutrient uptake outer membrane protein [Bacteroidaceae bacterium]|nr:RagB/SusD family nutrient uptake outer membrane protein [Bacteroidaceae bacterium]